MSLPPWKKLLNTAQIMHDHSEKPAGLEWRSNRLFIVATVGLGLFTDLFLYGLVIPVLPFMLVDHIGLPPDQIQDNVSNLLSAYAGASVAIAPIAGIITDKLRTRRAPFLLGIAALLAATVLLLVGSTISMLLVARALQGISASFVWTTGMALCLETVGAENLGKTIGTIFGFISVGTLLAPMLGGVLYSKGGLVGVFGLAFTLLALDFVMRVLVIEVKVARRYEQAEGDAGDVVATGATQPQAGVADEEEDGGRDERSSLLTNTRNKDGGYKISPDLPKAMRFIHILPCLAAPRLLAALTIAFVQAVLLASIDATVPLVCQEYFGFSSLQAGLMFLPIGIANLMFGPLLGWCVDKFGTRRMAVLVYLYLVPVLLLFRFARPGKEFAIVVYEILLALAGIGTAGMGAPSVVEASAVIQKYHQANPAFFGEHGPYAQLYSLSFLFYSLGLAVGPELAGRLRQAVGYGNMNAVLAALCATTALICFVFLKGKSKKTIQGATA